MQGSDAAPDVEKGEKKVVEVAGELAEPRQRRRRGPIQALTNFLQSWVSRTFARGAVVLFPICVTLWICAWFFGFFEQLFSPTFRVIFGFQVFGLGFLSSMLFIFIIGLFASSWIGNLLLSLGEWIIERVPLVKSVYSAMKQISSAMNPVSEKGSFRECVVIRHPRRGEYAFAFLTGHTQLQTLDGSVEDLVVVYLPTNHMYIGDILLLSERDVFRTSLTVSEGIELIVSGGSAVPEILSELDPDRPQTPTSP
mmetsp:Transcript_23120/g.75376  ORF Transcript_23120/g.75376 Transcript_23120/m.75376 type:complete len:253 (+) Transcript_23120:30-788(+)